MRLSCLSNKEVHLHKSLEISSLVLDTKVECNMSTGASVLFVTMSLCSFQNKKYKFLLKPLLQYVFMGK